MARMTLIGMSNYMDKIGKDLFADIYTHNDIDRETLIDTILIRCGEAPMLYTDPDFVKRYIKRWSDKWSITFDRWIETLTEEYDPIHNYDRNEDYTDTENVTASSSSQTSATHNVSAYDSSTLQPDASTGGNDTASSTSGLMRSHNAHMYGNIGVTTSQEMLEAEITLRGENNIYGLIAEQFYDAFCIYVY